MWITEVYLVNSPCPEGGRHHLCHVTTEGIDTLGSPEEQDIRHLIPCIGDRQEMLRTTAGITIVDAVVEFHGLIPVITVWCISKTIISRGLGRYLRIYLLLACNMRKNQRLAPTIIEIITDIEMVFLMVVLTEILHTGGLADTLILPGHMIGNKIHDYLEACLMRAGNESLKLLHTMIHILG